MYKTWQDNQTQVQSDLNKTTLVLQFRQDVHDKKFQMVRRVIAQSHEAFSGFPQPPLVLRLVTDCVSSSSIWSAQLFFSPPRVPVSLADAGLEDFPDDPCGVLQLSSFAFVGAAF